MDTNQLFDKIIKRAMRLSGRAIVNFINGLFDKNFPVDSRVTYYSTENITDKFEKNVSDVIITINDTEKFLVESQSRNDNEMVVRVFDYSYYDAIKNKDAQDGEIILKFANPKVIYLGHTKSTPDELTLRIVFEHQEPFVFKVPTMKFLNYDIEDLNNQKLVILLPLYILKLRKKIERRKTVENAEALQDLINNGIIKSIEKHVELGTITHEDARMLMVMLGRLYDEIYGDIELFKEKGVAEMIEDRLILATDIAEEKGREEGRKELAIQMTKRLLNMNMPVDEITKVTELSVEDIELLKLEMEIE